MIEKVHVTIYIIYRNFTLNNSNFTLNNSNLDVK